MPKQRFGLGRGLDALIPGGGVSGGGAGVAISAVPDDMPLDTGLSNSSVFDVPVASIIPNPQQPRMPMAEDGQLLELAASIQEYGLLQPVLVTLVPDDEEEEQRYQLIAGERRWRAAQIAGLETIPAVIRDATPQLVLEMALVENLQRTDLSPLEEAHGYQLLMEEYNLTQEQVAKSVGRNRATIANTIRLLQLPQEVQEALIMLPKVFTEGHARAVLTVNGEAERIALTKQIIAQNLNVRQAEEMARRYNEASLRLTPDRRGARVRSQSYETKALEEEFMRALEMKARLQRSTKGKGSLTLYFSNDEQLQRIYSIVVGHGQPAGLSADADGMSGTYDLDNLDAMIDDSLVVSFDDDDGSHNNGN